MSDTFLVALLIFGFIGAMFLYVLLDGIKDVIVSRKTIDYATAANKKSNEEFMASLDAEELIGDDVTDMQFYTPQN